MAMTPEEIAAANKAQLDSLLNLTKQAFQGMEQLVSLNMQVAKQSLEHTAERAKEMAGLSDIKGLEDIQSKLIQPATEKALAMGRQIADITAKTQAEVSRVAQEQAAAAQAQFQGLADAAGQHLPAQAELQAMAQKALDQANATFEGVQQAAKLAASTAEDNLKQLMDVAERAGKAAAEEIKKGRP